MKKLSFLAFAFAFLALGCSCPVCSSCSKKYSDTVNEGFSFLFNGKDFSGWEGATDIFSIDTNAPAAIVAAEKKVSQNRVKNLVTKKSYGNFVLRYEFCLPKGGKSSLGMRMSAPGENPSTESFCEVKLLDDGAFYDAKTSKDLLKPYEYCSSVYAVKAPLRDNFGKQIWGKDKNFSGAGSYVRKPGMWNFQEIKVIGDEIEVYLNGYLVSKADLSEDKALDAVARPIDRKEGRIGLVYAGTEVKFRNIRIKELPVFATMDGVCPSAREKCPKGFKAYFDGDEEDLLANWKGVTNKEKFDNPKVRHQATSEKRKQMQSVADEQMLKHWHVKNGALYFDGYSGGYSLATKEDYEDFELWADWRILSITGDSGLYLRGSPQVQIWDAHNQWKIGSGGLYNNRTRVTGNPSKALCIADNLVGDWNRFHVIMRGERVWVRLNGKLVVDGVKLENYWDRSRPIFGKEQIELQCHGDPIEWRNIFIRHLPTAKVPVEKVGVCSWSYRLPIKQVAVQMDKAGIKGIHLALGPFIHPDGRHGDAAESDDWQFVKDRISSGKWKLLSTMVGTVGEDYSTLETIKVTGGIVPDKHWAANQKIISQGAKLTQELGCKLMSFHAGFLDEGNSAAKAKFVERLLWARDEAKKYGVTLILESGQETAEDLARFMKEIPGIFINFDPANMILYNTGNPHEALKKLIPWIRQIHAKDALYTKKPGTWGTETPWGDGEVKGKIFVKELYDLGYRGDFVIEREGGDDRVKDINLAVERLTK